MLLTFLVLLTARFFSSSIPILSSKKNQLTFYLIQIPTSLAYWQNDILFINEWLFENNFKHLFY